MKQKLPKGKLTMKLGPLELAIEAVNLVAVLLATSVLATVVLLFWKQ